MPDPRSPSAAKERPDDLHVDAPHSVWKAARKREGLCPCDTCWFAFVRSPGCVAADRLPDPACAARVSHPPHHLHTFPCDRPGKFSVDGVPVCGTHKRVAERWLREGRLHAMVASWWAGK